jgi:hypothetical protein
MEATPQDLCASQMPSKALDVEEVRMEEPSCSVAFDNAIEQCQVSGIFSPSAVVGKLTFIDSQ